MGFKLKSGNKPEFKQMGSSPSAIRTMGSPFHETENEKEPKEEFNMMNNPPPDPDPDPAGPAPDPDPDPDPDPGPAAGTVAVAVAAAAGAGGGEYCTSITFNGVANNPSTSTSAADGILGCPIPPRPIPKPMPPRPMPP